MTSSKVSGSSILGLVVAAFLLVVLWLALYLWIPLESAKAHVGRSWGQMIADSGEPFFDGLRDGILSVFDPRLHLYVSGNLLVLAAAILAVVLWVASDVSAGRGKELFQKGSAAALPLLVGVAWFAVDLRGAFSALAEAGLSSPQLVGIGTAEALAASVTGLLMTCLLLAGLFVAVQVRRRTSQPTAEGA